MCTNEKLNILIKLEGFILAKGVNIIFLLLKDSYYNKVKFIVVINIRIAKRNDNE